MKVEYFSNENWNISKRNMELFEDRVQRVIEKFISVKRLDSLVLCTGFAKNIKFEILSCLEALEDFK